MVSFNPVELANNIKKNGGFVPGIRPGKPTSDYIAKVLNRVTWFGALFLAFITIFPSLLQTFTNIANVWFGSTSLLIMVNVALETVKQVESQMLMRHYKGFLD
jgi:preprotein translocase subunit SecY